MNNGTQLRTYIADDCAVFRVTTEQYGGLSNMAGGFPLRINGTTIWSAEAIYQACRFPERPDIQKIILAERSPMTAKMKSKPYRKENTRPDWEIVKVKVMKWCLRVKLAQNWIRFGDLLRSTDNRPIVEESRKDDFWGAKRQKDGTLVGMNVLGRLLMELRQELGSTNPDSLRFVTPPEIPNFLLLGHPIPSIAPPTESVDAKSMPAIPAEPLVTFENGGRPNKKLSRAQAAPSLWPESTEEDVVSNAGVHLTGLKITGALGYVFRAKAVSDVGIDGEIEIRDGGKSHGRLVALQIKTGPSYFKERTKKGFVFRGSMTHLRYWLNYSVPVLVVLCDLKEGECYWALVDLENIRFHERSWSMEIPFAQKLDRTAVNPIRKISTRFQRRDIVDLLFKNWLVESHYYSLILADILEQPRDYHWLRFLAQDSKHHFVMADYITADLQRFDSAEIEEMIRWAQHNHKEFGYERFLLALISETSQSFPIPNIPKVAEAGLTIEMVPLIFKLDDQPRLCEVGSDGRLITYYFDHRAFDGSGAEVPLQRSEMPASIIA